MKSFLTALQFLTRIHIKNQDLTAEDFGRSTRFFPLVGALLGIIYVLVAWALTAVFGWASLVTTLIMLLPVFFTGGLLLDGFMDTVDGVFSGRERERQLEIMKDSRVGSFGVIALVALMFINWTTLRDINLQYLVSALFLMPIIGRMGMVLVICAFPYARPEGMGRIFAAMADRRTFLLALTTTLFFTISHGVLGMVALGVGLIFAYGLGRWLMGKLGGLTGDTYGAIETLTETVVLVVFWLVSYYPGAVMLIGR